MATSFSKILKANASALSATPSVASVAEVAIADITPLVETDNLIAAYSGEETYAEESWRRCSGYLWYDEYTDENYSTVDEEKHITINPKQINLTQEARSQYIPFQMPRYYDGVDLVTKNLLVQFENKNGEGSYLPPVNVECSNTKIRFGLLPDESFTAVAGEVKIEIQAIGSTSKGDTYVFKTRSGVLNVERSLANDGVITPNVDWTTSFITQVNEKVIEAETAAREAMSSATQAESYANAAIQAAADSEITIEEAKTELEKTIANAVEERVEGAFSDYYKKPEVDQLMSNLSGEIDLVKQQINTLDGLANFNVEYDGTTMTFYNGETVVKEIAINSDPSEEWTNTYTAQVDEKISIAVTGVQDSLDTYKTATDADLTSIHEAIDGLPETLASDYYTKTATDNIFAKKTDVDIISTVTSTNRSNIESIGETISELQEEVQGIDKSPRLTYDVNYNDLEDPNSGENKFVLYQITNEGLENEIREVKKSFIITGGSGSGGGSTLKIEYVTKTPVITTIDDKVLITYKFSGVDSSGDEVMEGQASWKIGTSVVKSEVIVAGENTVDLTNFISTGTQKVTLTITDDNGSLASKSWTVQKIDVRIESSFNDKLTYSLGQVAFDYTPYGAISKDIHFILDGEEIHTATTSASGVPMGYNIPTQTHGSHLLDVYMTATVNNNTITSNHIVKDILWFDEASNVPVIGCTQTNIKALQYDTTNIEYTVYDPTTETPKVTLAVDGNVVSTLTMEKNTDTWQFKSSDVGNHVLTITCGETVKTINVEVEKLDITIEPVIAGLVIDFNPVGKSNSDADRVWSNDTYKMTVSDNFDWVNGGYQIDTNGDQYFCIKAGTNVELDYQMFADDAKRNGKEMKLIFKTTNVQQADAKFMTCVDNTTGSDHIGIEMFAHEAFIYGSADKLHLKYSENDIIEFEFNITNNQEAVTEICGYEDGVATRHLVYDDTFNFTQTTPKVIKLGSDRCDLHIYRMKVYNTSLTDRGILSNFIADARSAEEMINRYNRNQIYDENSQLTPEVLAEKCPWLRVYVVSAPYFTNKKSDKVQKTTIRQIYKNGDPILDNWTCYYCMHSGRTNLPLVYRNIYIRIAKENGNAEMQIRMEG